MNWFELPKDRWRNSSQTSRYREWDFQKQKCYDAERVFRNALGEKNEMISTVVKIQAYVDRICSYAWFKRRWGEVKVTVKQTVTGCARGSYLGSWIKLPIWLGSKVVILHELAHAITPPSTGGGHGRYWAKTFLELVHHAMGESEMVLLRDNFKAYKVKYLPRKQLSETTRAAARERFVTNVLKRGATCV